MFYASVGCDDEIQIFFLNHQQRKGQLMTHSPYIAKSMCKIYDILDKHEIMYLTTFYASNAYKQQWIMLIMWWRDIWSIMMPTIGTHHRLHSISGNENSYRSPNKQAESYKKITYQIRISRQEYSWFSAFWESDYSICNMTTRIHCLWDSGLGWLKGLCPLSLEMYM